MQSKFILLNLVDDFEIFVILCFKKYNIEIAPKSKNEKIPLKHQYTSPRGITLFLKILIKSERYPTG